jgi:hypothetical protein
MSKLSISLDAIASLPVGLQVRVAHLTDTDNGQEIHDLAKQMALTSVFPYRETLPLAEEFVRSGFDINELNGFCDRTRRSLTDGAVLMLEARRLC